MTGKSLEDGRDWDIGGKQHWMTRLQECIEQSRECPLDIDLSNLQIDQLHNDYRWIVGNIVSWKTLVAFQWIRNNTNWEFEKYEMLSRSFDTEWNSISPVQYMWFIEAAKLDNALVLLNLVHIKEFLIMHNYVPIINVNFWRNQLRNNNFIITFVSELKRLGIPIKNINIEIIEHCKMDVRVLHAIYLLKQVGIMVWLDDFWTWSANLDTLLKFHPDFIKIPWELITPMDTKLGMLLLTTIVNISNTLNIPLIAEKVETKEQEWVLAELWVKYSQWYLYQQPIIFPDNQ